MGVRRAVAWAALVAAAASCSLVTPLDGYTGGAGALPEAGSSRDADVPEASVVDAGGDAAEVDADAGGFCSAAKGGFCVDYDTGELGTWNGTDVSTNATTVVDAGALLVTVGPGGGSSACFKKILTTGVQQIDVDFDVRVEAMGTADFDLVGIRGTGDHNVTLQVNAGAAAKMQFDEDIPVVDGGPDETITSTSFTFDGAWHHIRWTHSLAGGKSNVEALVDGTSRGSIVAAAADYSAPTTFELGDCVLSTSATWKIRYDNVLVVTK